MVEVAGSEILIVYLFHLVDEFLLVRAHQEVLLELHAVEDEALVLGRHWTHPIALCELITLFILCTNEPYLFKELVHICRILQLVIPGQSDRPSCGFARLGDLDADGHFSIRVAHLADQELRLVKVFYLGPALHRRIDLLDCLTSIMFGTLRGGYRPCRFVVLIPVRTNRSLEFNGRFPDDLVIESCVFLGLGRVVRPRIDHALVRA